MNNKFIIIICDGIVCQKFFQGIRIGACQGIVLYGTPSQGIGKGSLLFSVGCGREPLPIPYRNKIITSPKVQSETRKPALILR